MRKTDFELKSHGALTECRVLKNPPEEAFRKEATEKGWFVSKRGWPDFICVKESEDGEMKVLLVEIKPHRRRILKMEQMFILKLLSSYGVPCYRWSPEDGFEKIDESSKRSAFD